MTHTHSIACSGKQLGIEQIRRATAMTKTRFPTPNDILTRNHRQMFAGCEADNSGNWCQSNNDRIVMIEK
jgi:hypothetical protein